VSESKKMVGERELSESAKLKKENERLKKESDFLKKWQRYLAEKHQNALGSSKDTESD
jgi:transposase